MAASSTLALAQQVTLALGSATAQPASIVSVNLTATPISASPTSMQWRLTYPMSSISTVTFLPGAAAIAAGKSLTCANNAGWVDCILFGINTSAIQSGVVATATVTILPGIAATVASLAITNQASTDITALSIPTTATGGSISVVPPAPATWTISGTVASGSGATVTLSGAASKATTADASGNYSFTGLLNGSYAVAAAKSGFGITPSNQAVTVNGANVGGVNFTATQTPSTWSISGTVTLGSGAAITLSGTSSGSATADASGNFTFSGLANGSYTVAAAKSGFTMTPSSRAVTVSGANVSAVNFTAAQIPSTWTITGTVSSGSGATVNLSGAVSKTATADASGNYSFSGLGNGSYTVMATKSGFSMTPSSRAVTVNGANVSAVNFTATLIANTWTISGTIEAGSGATVTLGGAAAKTTTADTAGKYAFTGLVNGSYTVAPQKTGVTFTPSARAVTLTGANQTADFAGASQSGSSPVVDRTVWSDRSQKGSNLTSPSFSTTQANELLLAFIGTDSTSGTETVRSVSGGGLNWVLVRRTNTQGGTAEIWRAFATTKLSQAVVTANISQRVAGSITVMTFTGVDASGTNGSGAIGATGSGNSRSGAPVATLVTTRNPSLIFGVGTDANSSTARTPASGQSMVHQFANSGSGAYWVQSLDTPPPAGTTATIRDTSPTWSTYNLSIVEVRGPAAVGLSEISAVPFDGSGTTEGVPTRRRSSQSVLTNTITGEAEAACTPGGWASVTGMNFTAQSAQTASSFPLPWTLAGVRVDVNGQPAPLLLVSPEQVNFQCPQVAVGTALNIAVTSEAGNRIPVTETHMSAAAPAIFIAQGSEQAVMQIAADPLNNGRPAHPGEHVRIYAIGLGETASDVAQGMPAPLDQTVRTKNHVVVTFGGIELEPLFAGLAPGMVGVFQLDLELPRGIEGTDLSVAVRVEQPDGSSRVSPQARLTVGATSSESN
ncbi:MAG: carboxypeptidase regulatory-like domain-containing protein [Bryobacteraceae bacterium]